MRKTLYLIGAFLGTVLPYFYFIQFFQQQGLDIVEFGRQLFVTPAAAGLAMDLFISSFVFWIFMLAEGRKRGMGNLWVYIVLNLAVGLSLALPLFLYMRERALEARMQGGSG